MAINFIPKEMKFFDYLNLQGENLMKAAAFFKEAVKDGVLDDAEVKKIHDLEHEGDTLAHEITDMLNRTFITPIDREDIYALANQLDDVLDMLNAMAGRVKLYKLNTNDEYFAQFIDLIDQAAAALAGAVKYMPDNKRQRRVLDYCIEINRLENLGDSVREKAIGNLFDTEKDPVKVIKWKEIYEVAEGTLDKCEHVAKVIESILVKHG
jgi:predicted phosphate transport protein (TIGR00153 family)